MYNSHTGPFVWFTSSLFTSLKYWHFPAFLQLLSWLSNGTLEWLSLLVQWPTNHGTDLWVSVFPSVKGQQEWNISLRLLGKYDGVSKMLSLLPGQELNFTHSPNVTVSLDKLWKIHLFISAKGKSQEKADLNLNCVPSYLNEFGIVVKQKVI